MICNIFFNFIVSILLIAPHRSISAGPYCIRNATQESKATLDCATNRIEIHTLIYANISNQTADCGRVSLPSNSVKIQQDQLRKHKLYTECSFLHGCSNKSICTASCPLFNYFYVEFSCVKVNESIDICGDERKTISSTTNIAHSGGNRGTQNGMKNCYCVIEGGVHNITRVHVIIPIECNSTMLSLKWNTTHPQKTQGRNAHSGAVFTHEQIVNASSSTSLRFNTTCDNIAEMVWLKIVPESGFEPTVYCGKSVENISSITNTSSRPLVPTKLTTPKIGETTEVYKNHTESSEPETNTTMIYQTDLVTSESTDEARNDSLVSMANQTDGSTELDIPVVVTTVKVLPKTDLLSDDGETRKLGLITGCTIGGLALIVIILVPFIVCYRRRRHVKKQPPSYGLRFEESNVVRYENVPIGGIQLFNNDGFLDSETETTTDYRHPGNPTITTFQLGKVRDSNNQHMHGACSRNDYDAAAADVYDHIQSVPSVQPKNTDHPPDQDDTYNLLYQNHNRAAAETIKPAPRSAKSEPPAVAIYSEISDMDVSLRPKEQPSKQRTNSYTYSVVDKSKFKAKTNSTEGGQPPFYHVLKKQPDANFEIKDSEYNERASVELAPGVNDLAREFVDDDVQEYTDDKISCEIDRAANVDPRGGVEFADNELYESAGDFNSESNRDVNHDLQSEIEYADNELYESAGDFNSESNRDVNHDLQSEIEFADNELYESAGDFNSESNRDVNHDLQSEIEFADNELYESSDDLNSESNRDANHNLQSEIEFAENELCESAGDFKSESNRDVNPTLQSEIEFADNELYESADNIETDENNRVVNSESYKETEFVENELYESADDMISHESRPGGDKTHDSNKDIEFEDNDLYQSADQL